MRISQRVPQLRKTLTAGGRSIMRLSNAPRPVFSPEGD